MRTITVECAAPSRRAWALLARPDRWHEWAPQLRGAWGFGNATEVVAGTRGAARLLGVVPVPARILAKEDGRSWTWRVGPATMVHRVEPRGDGCAIAWDVAAPGALEPALAATYGPVVGVLLRRLARIAERDASLTAAAR